MGGLRCGLLPPSRAVLPHKQQKTLCRDQRETAFGPPQNHRTWAQSLRYPCCALPQLQPHAHLHPGFSPPTAPGSEVDPGRDGLRQIPPKRPALVLHKLPTPTQDQGRDFILNREHLPSIRSSPSPLLYRWGN